MNLSNDSRVVLTLDAGGTNFVFSAIKANKEIVQPVKLSPDVTDRNLCLDAIIMGFKQVIQNLNEKPSAISFAFPGPADYPSGIIGDLENLPAFRGGVPLGPILEEYFGLPVFINNDGNLFAYGEALGGFLPYINQKLLDAGSSKRFHNLIGVTLGTGFGVGLVTNNQLIAGDNSNGGEGWLLRDSLNPDCHVEEHLSREGIRRSYAQKAKLPIQDSGSPEEIYKIAKGNAEGNMDAAIMAFNDYGTVLGEALANIITLFDGIVVLGGGVAGAYGLFAPAMMKQMASGFRVHGGHTIKRLIPKMYNLENSEELNDFLSGNVKELAIPNSSRMIKYDPVLRSGVAVSKNDTAEIIAMGAYAFALKMLDK